MIRLTRPASPAILDNDCVELNQRNCDAFAADPTAYQNGSLKFNFEGKNRAYGDASVKKVLIEAQHKKCCFCETKVTHSPGDVEHYRPKARVDQNEDDGNIRPGYFWLAYNWDNLLFSCDDCNRRYKKNYFPLKDPSKRALSPKADLAQEEPLIIDPFTENPEDYIAYRGAEPFAIDNNEKGIETIKRTGLKDTARLSFNEDRINHLTAVEDIYITLRDGSLPESLKTRLEKALQDYQQPESEYSLMIKCAVRDKFQFV